MKRKYYAYSTETGLTSVGDLTHEGMLAWLKKVSVANPMRCYSVFALVAQAHVVVPEPEVTIEEYK